MRAQTHYIACNVLGAVGLLPSQRIHARNAFGVETAESTRVLLFCVFGNRHYKSLNEPNCYSIPYYPVGEGGAILTVEIAMIYC